MQQFKKSDISVLSSCFSYYTKIEIALGLQKYYTLVLKNQRLGQVGSNLSQINLRGINLQRTKRPKVRYTWKTSLISSHFLTVINMRNNINFHSQFKSIHTRIELKASEKTLQQDSTQDFQLFKGNPRGQ